MVGVVNMYVFLDVDGGVCDRPSVCGLLNASFMFWLEHYLNAHCGTVFLFYLLDKKSSH
jgi:hypothetical protein